MEESRVLAEVVRSVTPEAHAALRRALGSVGDLMTRDVATLRPEQSVADAIVFFGQRQFRHLLVTGNDRLAGVLSDRDILRWLARNPGATDTAVSRIMTRDTVTVEPATSVSHAIHLFIEHRINCLPVIVGDGRVAGILTTTDLLRALHTIQHWLEDRAAPGAPG
jgi:acetoin utilization protein AcuB